MTDLPTRLRTEADSIDRIGARLQRAGVSQESTELRERAKLMRAAADEIERLREVPLAALDAATPPTVPQVQALADAMWQLLDDMGTDGRNAVRTAVLLARVEMGRDEG